MDIASLIRDPCAILVQVGAGDIMTGKTKTRFSAFKLAAELADSRLLEKTPDLPQEIVDQGPKFPFVIEKIESVRVSAHVPQRLCLGEKRLRLEIWELRVQRRIG